MSKKKVEHGPLYQHAVKELELAGLASQKSHMDQMLYSTVLRLVDTFERGGINPLVKQASINFFTNLAAGDVISEITDSADEWKPEPAFGEGIFVNKRCEKYLSRDGGITWFHTDSGAQGYSKRVEEESYASTEENQTDVQPPKS